LTKGHLLLIRQLEAGRNSPHAKNVANSVHVETPLPSSSGEDGTDLARAIEVLDVDQPVQDAV